MSNRLRIAVLVTMILLISCTTETEPTPTLTPAQKYDELCSDIDPIELAFGAVDTDSAHELECLELLAETATES